MLFEIIYAPKLELIAFFTERCHLIPDLASIHLVINGIREF